MKPTYKDRNRSRSAEIIKHPFAIGCILSMFGEIGLVLAALDSLSIVAFGSLGGVEVYLSLLCLSAGNVAMLLDLRIRGEK